MSRSRKKNQFYKDPPSKNMKRFANKRVRKSKDFDNFNSYKKLYNSYYLSDYKFQAEDSFEKYYERIKRSEPDVDKKKLYKFWLRWYYSK